jgi:DNA invertase Pin-like site-specific DNA recombinase
MFIEGRLEILTCQIILMIKLIHMERKKRVALFIRVSTEKQSYIRQVSELSSFCKEHQYDIALTIANKISGAKKYSDRPDLMELYEAADKKLFDLVLVSEISRLGRDARTIRSTIDYLHDRNIPVVFCNLGGMSSLDEKGNETFLVNTVVALLSEMAAEERRLLSSRIKSGLVEARKRHGKLGRPEGSTLDNTAILKKYPRLASDLRNNLSVRKAMKVHSLSQGTVMKVKKLL